MVRLKRSGKVSLVSVALEDRESRERVGGAAARTIEGVESWESTDK